METLVGLANGKNSTKTVKSKVALIEGGGSALPWLVEEVRRDSRGNGSLGSGDQSDDLPDHPVYNLVVDARKTHDPDAH